MSIQLQYSFGLLLVWSSTIVTFNRLNGSLAGDALCQVVWWDSGSFPRFVWTSFFPANRWIEVTKKELIVFYNSGASADGSTSESYVFLQGVAVVFKLLAAVYFSWLRLCTQTKMEVWQKIKREKKRVDRNGTRFGSPGTVGVGLLMKVVEPTQHCTLLDN